MNKMRLEKYKTTRILPLSLMLMLQTSSFAQSTTKNYVQTKTFLDDAGTTFLRHIDYYDELGFVSETVDVGGNSSQTPIVARTDYNTQLKPFRQWASAPTTGLDYLDEDGVYDAAFDIYNDNTPYSENWYDDFQQLSSSRKPGIVWDDRDVTISRHVVPADVVRKYSVSANGSLSDDGWYPYGLLMSTTTTDEDGRSMTVYTDFHGNTVLERRDNGNDTYYVYDKFGRLSYVLPPMCQGLSSTSELSKYWYKYTYDDRGRCTEKQLPGCEPIKYWYDEANHIQSEQDGHLRAQSLYRNYSYDAIGRQVLQTISRTRGEATESNAVAVEVKNYYDDYASCRTALSSTFLVWADSINARQLLPTAAKGKLTATLHTTSNAIRYFEMYGYDELGRMTYKISAYGDNWLKIGHTAYNFVGDVSSVLESVYKHVDYPKFLLARRLTNYAYHPGTRLLASTTVTHVDKNNNTSTQVISNPTYDVYGNTVANNRPGTAADMVYSYDTLHGWLTGVSSPCGFSEQLLREDAAVPLFSGNIGTMLWRNTSTGEQHRYDYTYDTLGRLTSSLYSSSAIGTEGRFDETVTYNANGSIMSLLRNGMKNDGTFGAIDDLTVTYDGNRLMKVTDDAEALNYNGALDFDDGADTTCEYDYDSDGALTRDDNRGINSITYDYGHHPSVIARVTKKKTVYNDYTPDGMKLSSRHVSYIPTGNGGNYRIYVKDLYVDGLMLRDGSPLLWQFDGGYVDLNANGTPTSWNYYVTDHLGSTRMIVDSNDSIREAINYYPFGSEMQMTNPALMTEASSHPFRFTGKELDRQNGLNMYDFGARWYDVAGVPMWTSVDPLCEKNPSVTPYHFCHNDPINRIDSDGMDDYYTRSGDYLGTNKEKTDNIYITDEGQYRKIEDGKFAINLSSRTALNDAELDADAYSKIFTNCFKLGGGNTSELIDSKIQVTVWQMEGGSKVSHNYTDNSSYEGDATASTDSDHTNGARITAYIWPQGTEERQLFSTRSNVNSTIIDHEFRGHYKNGYVHKDGVPDPTYKTQKESINWNKTTLQYKEYHNKVIKEHGW